MAPSPDPIHDRSTLAIRFVCDAILGLLLGFGLWLGGLGEAFALGLPALLVTPGGLSGSAAAKLGDRFWRDVLPWLH